MTCVTLVSRENSLNDTVKDKHSVSFVNLPLDVADVAIMPTNDPPKRKLSLPPTLNVRFDQIAHFPAHEEVKQRCKICKNYVRIECIKCDSHLCMTIDTVFYSFTLFKTFRDCVSRNIFQLCLFSNIA